MKKRNKHESCLWSVFFSAFQNQQFLNQPECIYLLQAKGLAVSKREAKEEGGGKGWFQTAKIKKFVITTKLWSKPTHSGPCRLGDLTKPSPHFWRPSCKKCHLMNLSAEAVSCLSEVSASDKRLGPPPPVTDRPASWRLRPQSNHATRTGPAPCSWSVTLWAEGARRGWVEGGLCVTNKHSLLFPCRSPHAGSLGTTSACAEPASCREIAPWHIIAIMQFNISVLPSFYSCPIYGWLDRGQTTCSL